MAFATVNFFSRALNRTVPVNVLIPTDKRVKPGRPAPSPGPYKTLYLLHGILGNYTDWINGTRLQKIADTYNLCVVMPSGDNKFYADSMLSGDMYGQFIAQELVDLTRRTFRLSTRREDTFIGGLSMGGFGAITNALRHSETFSCCAALSSALVKESILHAYDEPGHDFFTRRQYMTMFSLDRIEDFNGCDADYDHLARRLAQTDAPRPRFYMACGMQDNLFDVNVAYRDLLVELGYDVTWQQWEGGHDWKFWDEAIERVIVDFLPLGIGEEAVSSGNVSL